MTRRLPCLLLALALACAAHEKSGDRAAALGDWRTAEREYAAAVAKEPENKELQEKYRQAKAAALEDATKRAQACPRRATGSARSGRRTTRAASTRRARRLRRSAATPAARWALSGFAARGGGGPAGVGRRAAARRGRARRDRRPARRGREPPRRARRGARRRRRGGAVPRRSPVPGGGGPPRPRGAGGSGPRPAARGRPGRARALEGRRG